MSPPISPFPELSDNWFLELGAEVAFLGTSECPGWESSRGGVHGRFQIFPRPVPCCHPALGFEALALVAAAREGGDIPLSLQPFLWECWHQPFPALGAELLEKDLDQFSLGGDHLGMMWMLQ